MRAPASLCCERRVRRAHHQPRPVAQPHTGVATERYSSDPEEIARLASGVVGMILRTGCRQAVESALPTKKDMEGIRLDWPKGKGSEQKTGQVS